MAFLRSAKPQPGSREYKRRTILRERSYLQQQITTTTATQNLLKLPHFHHHSRSFSICPTQPEVMILNLFHLLFSFLQLFTVSIACCCCCCCCCCSKNLQSPPPPQMTACCKSLHCIVNSFFSCVLSPPAGSLSELRCTSPGLSPGCQCHMGCRSKLLRSKQTANYICN